MFKIALMLWIVIAPTLAGILFTAGLAMGNANEPTDNRMMLIGLAVAGFVIAIPVAWIVAKKVTTAFGRRSA
ncbi:hypothetical protein [Rhodobium gokarnense]|uniref:CTP synthetase n=1 Tax=Rhodobium gokarnense TaxID=364296 RepID=A0ABT3HD93_9HYPH|nr:hypothetical protein [Rhodobium gokarnense]MCW2308373.1 hypothetical protein [Rhodobium gokarnense]